MRLTKNQINRLRELLGGPAYLADWTSGGGRRATVAGRAFWNTYGSLSSVGLCRSVTRPNGDLVSAFEITDDGRRVIAEHDGELLSAVVAADNAAGRFVHKPAGGKPRNAVAIPEELWNAVQSAIRKAIGR